MPGFAVTFSEMYNAANRIHQAAEDYLTAACKVYALAELLGESWEGDSHEAFMEEQRKATEWFKKMAALVESYVQMIQRAARAYQEADQKATGSIQDGVGIGVVIGEYTPMVAMLYAAPGFFGFGNTLKL